MSKNQRELDRTPAVLNTTYESLDLGRRELFRAITKDITRKGICILSEKALSPGEQISLKVAFLDPTVKVIPLIGKVVWKNNWMNDGMDPKFLMGIEFTGLKESFRSTLDFYMERLTQSIGMEDIADCKIQERLNNRLASAGKSFPVQMTHLKMPPVKMASIAQYVPEQVITNQDLVNRGLNTTEKTIERALGAVERRVAQSYESNAHMMAMVAKKILKDTSLDVSQLDRIICSSDPQDTVVPNTAVVVQRLLDARCPAFDVQMSCVGWLCAVELASRCIATGEKRILVLSSSTIGSRLFFYNSMHRAIFGDGAGGILLEADPNASQILSLGLWSDGSYNDKIYAPYSWSNIPDSIPKEYKNSFFMSPAQEDFFATMDFNLLPFCEQLWNDAGVSKSDIDCFILHQPSMPLFEHSIKSLDVPRSKTLDYYSKYGNLVSAEIPVYIDEAIRSGRIKQGDTIFALTYGAGFTMGGAVIRL